MATDNRLTGVAALKWVKWTILMSVVTGTVAYLAPRPIFVPQELRGRWVTDSEQYIDRHLDIGEAVLSFGPDGVEIRVMTIVQVEKRVVTGGARDTLHYRDKNGDRQRLRLQYTASDAGGQIQLARQRGIVWCREMPDDGS